MYICAKRVIDPSPVAWEPNCNIRSIPPKKPFYRHALPDRSLNPGQGAPKNQVVVPRALERAVIGVVAGSGVLMMVMVYAGGVWRHQMLG
jgi:hypothetical protein